MEELSNEFVLKCVANTSESSPEEYIYPVTVSEMVYKYKQHHDEYLRHYFKITFKVDNKDIITLRVIDDIEVLLYDKHCLVIPACMQSCIVQWYHHYLIHPGHTRLEETIAASMYWCALRTDIR